MDPISATHYIAAQQSLVPCQWWSASRDLPAVATGQALSMCSAVTPLKLLNQADLPSSECIPITCIIQAAASAGDVIELLSSDDDAASRPGLGTAEPQHDLPGSALGRAGHYSGDGGRPGSSTAQPAADPTGQGAGDMQDSDEVAAGGSGCDSDAASQGSQEGPRASRSLLAAEGRQGPANAQQAQARHTADAEGTQHLNPQEEVLGAVQGAAASSARHQLWAHHQQNRQPGEAACSQQASQAALAEAAQAGAAARSVLLAAALFARQRADHPPAPELAVQDAADAAEPTQQRDAGAPAAGASAVARSPSDKNKAEATTVHDAERMWTPFEVGEHYIHTNQNNRSVATDCLHIETVHQLPTS